MKNIEKLMGFFNVQGQITLQNLYFFRIFWGIHTNLHILNHNTEKRNQIV